jgi:hypothetical protein
VQLGQLAHSRSAPAGAEDAGQVGERARHPVRRLVEHHRPALGGQRGQALAAPAAAAGQEAFEAEPARREAADDQRGDDRGRAGDDGHPVAGTGRGPDEAFARIRDARRPGVGDDCDRSALVQQG